MAGDRELVVQSHIKGTEYNKICTILGKGLYTVQKQFPTKNDWILQIEEDLKMLDIDLSEKAIKKMKKHKFKKLIKKKLFEKSTEFLFNMKNKENRSKTKNLMSYKFQDYLQNNILTTKQKKLLFSLRTRSVDVKTNYKSIYTFNMQCRLCEKDEDSERHYLKCDKISNKIDPSIDLNQAKYENIFSSNIEEQINITRIFDQIFKIRSRELHKSN